MDPADQGADQGVEPSRFLVLANGHTIRFTIQQLPARAPTVLCSVAVLNAAWGPWHLFDGYLLSQIPFSLFGIHVPLCYWAEMWAGHPDYQRLKKQLDNIKLLISEYRRFPDPQDFYNIYPSSTHALEAARGHGSVEPVNERESKQARLQRLAQKKAIETIFEDEESQDGLSNEDEFVVEERKMAIVSDDEDSGNDSDHSSSHRRKLTSSKLPTS
ncbi:hypothetical protein EV715DRAFT_297110 [Schizophyllum commune]